MSEFWLDTRTGDLIVGQAALEQRLPDAGPGDIAPLSELITNDEFAVPIEDYDRFPLGKADRETLITYGKWVMKLLEDAPGKPKLTREHITRLSRLGIGYSFNQFRTQGLDVMWQYRQAIGAEPGKVNGRYDDWSEEDFTRHAEKVAETTAGKPMENDYEAYEEGPRVWLISRRIGISKLNEMIGYPDVASWQEEDFISWGAKVMAANDGRIPRVRLIEALSRRDRGPAATTINKVFGSVVTFQEKVKERYDTALNERAQQVAKYEKLYENLPPHITNATWRSEYDDSQRHGFAAKLLVTRECLPGLSEELQAAIADLPAIEFLTMIRHYDASLSDEAIEAIAEDMNASEDIFPSNRHWQEYLHIDEADVPYKRQGNKDRYA